jgi:hypothetical protein
MLYVCRYHCHTCKMVDGVGVCTVCARVCHKDHDLSYAKFGSFFCDCGAKEDGSCKVSCPNMSLICCRVDPVNNDPVNSGSLQIASSFAWHRLILFFVSSIYSL